MVAMIKNEAVDAAILEADKLIRNGFIFWHWAGEGDPTRVSETLGYHGRLEVQFQAMRYLDGEISLEYLANEIYAYAGSD